MATINRKETLAALETVKPALASRSSIPELSHIWFDGEFAYAHNGGLGIKTKLEVPLSCGIPGSLFLGLLNQTAAETIEFELVDDALNFKSGRSRLKLATLPLERKIWRYSEAPSGKPVASLKVSKAFLAALKTVLVLRPSNPKRMEHHAVCIFAFDKEMDLYVTDSKSMVLVPVAEPITGTAKKIALPRELAEQLVSQCDPGQTLKMYADHFAIDANSKTQTTLYSNVFDTGEMLDLPSYAHKFVDGITPFKLPEGLGVALERAVLLAGTEEALVTFNTSGKALKLSGRFKLGQLDEDFTLNKSIPKAKINVDAKALLSVKGINELSVSESVINLFGTGDFTYILASKEDPAASLAKEKEKEREPAEEE